MQKQHITVIVGPTASGKTSAAIDHAKKYNGYVISADSRQIYTDMDIGTAKPSGTLELVSDTDLTAYYVDGIPHFMIDITTPEKNFTLADFQKQTYSLLENPALREHFDTPIIAGGTGLYVQSIVDNYTLPQREPDEALRAALQKKSLTDLQKKLRDADPETFESIDIQNKRRVIRALEFTLTENASFIQAQQSNESPYTFSLYGMDIDKDTLQSRINARVDQMIANGLVDEVDGLLKQYDATLPALATIGYSEVIAHLQDKLSLGEAIEYIKIHTRQYAKRQMTWFKRDKRIEWTEKIAK